MDNFLIVASQVAILFLLMGVGAAARQWKLLTETAVDGLVNLLILLVTPCLIIDVFQRPFDPSMLKGLGLSFAIAVLGHLAVIALAYLFVRHRVEDIRRPLLLAAVFSNAGFMGIPLEQAVLGDVGVFYGAVYVAVFNLFIWSWGYMAMKKYELGDMNGGVRAFSSDIPRFHFPIQSFFVNPGTIGLAIGLPFFLLSVKLPAIVATPIHLMAGLNTPLAMIVIGYCLFGAKLGKVVRVPGVYVAAGIRLLAYPLLFVAVLYPFRSLLDRNMMLALTVSASAPVAAMVSMFATKFGRDVDVAVAVVSGTTLLSILTMPAVIAFAMSAL